MNNMEIIFGKTLEGKTKELINKLINYCNGKTIIDGKTYKNSDLVKPIFVYNEETLEAILGRIKNYDKDFDFDGITFINYNKGMIKVYSDIIENKDDVIVFVDSNICYNEIPNFIQNTLQYINLIESKGITIDIIFTVNKPKVL